MPSETIEIGTLAGKGSRTADYVRAIHMRKYLKGCRSEIVPNPDGF